MPSHLVKDAAREDNSSHRGERLNIDIFKMFFFDCCLQSLQEIIPIILSVCGMQKGWFGAGDDPKRLEEEGLMVKY